MNTLKTTLKAEAIFTSAHIDESGGVVATVSTDGLMVIWIAPSSTERELLVSALRGLADSIEEASDVSK